MKEDSVHMALRTSPHMYAPLSVDQIMWHVVYALVPVSAFAVYQFGLSALALLGVCTGVCVGTEHLCCRWAGKPSTVGDGSVVITGLLLALILPPAFPLWMAAVAGLFGVAAGKMFFGGLGCNIMNIALLGRAFAQAAFPLPMTTWVPGGMPGRFTSWIPTTWTPPFLQPASLDGWLSTAATDGFTGATPLALMKFRQVSTDTVDLLTGQVSGSSGETSALLILLCGVYLVWRRAMNGEITLSILISAAALSGIFYLIDPTRYPSPWFTLFAGGLMLGAVFMATDMVASPETRKGVWVYGGMIGVLTVVIRLFGGLSEGIMYAILLANAASPLISKATQPRRFGAVRGPRRKAA